MTARAVDRAGHVATASVRYRESRAWEHVEAAGAAVTARPGERVWLVVLTTGARPAVTSPWGQSRTVRRAGAFRGLARWHVAVRVPDSADRGSSYAVRVRGGGTREVLRLHVR